MYFTLVTGEMKDNWKKRFYKKFSGLQMEVEGVDTDTGNVIDKRLIDCDGFVLDFIEKELQRARLEARIDEMVILANFFNKKREQFASFVDGRYDKLNYQLSKLSKEEK